MINKQFPTYFDVEQAIRFRSTSYEDLRRFMQSVGLINVGNGKEHVAEFAANILFEHQEYISIRRLAQGADTATNISGFTLRPIGMPITIDNLKDDLVKLRDRLIKQADEAIKRGAPLQELTMPQIEGATLRMTFKYQRVIPGRVELMQRVDTEVEFKIEAVSETRWRVVCFPESNQDVKIIEQMFEKIGKDVYEPFTISLENFTRQQRIQFFDTILAYYNSHPEWQVREVVGITVRQPTESDHKMLLLGEDIDTNDSLFA